MAATAYIEKADIEAAITASRLGQYCDDAGTWVSGSEWTAGMTTNLTDCINRASSEIDAYLRPNYTVPLSYSSLSDSSKNFIRNLALELVVWFLKNRRMESITEGDYTKYKNACGLLEKLAAGKIKIDIGDAADNVIQTGSLPTSARAQSTTVYEPTYNIDDDDNDPMENF